MNNFDGVEKGAAAREAREAVGGQQRGSSRTSEVKAALMRYLTTEQYRERTKGRHAADGDKGRDSGTSS